MSDDLERNLKTVRSQIEDGCERAGRDPAGVTLVAITKTFPMEDVVAAFELGVRDFGENYVRELREKQPALPEARWHYIGALQSHTARHVADHASWVHGLEPGTAVTRLAHRAATAGKRIPALIQVDFAGDRNGVAPEGLATFAAEVAALEGVALSGLMTLPPAPEDPEDSRPYFRKLRRMRDDLRERFPEAVQLSMGMSLDYSVAVEEGATMVRVGTALFGERAS